MSGILIRASLVAQRVTHLPAMWETCVRFLDWEDLLEKEMATPSGTLAWKIPWMEEPGSAVLQADSLPTELPRKPPRRVIYIYLGVNKG